jgi:hypothetical protein
MFFGGRRDDKMINNFLAVMREVPERYLSVYLLPLSDWFISDHKRYTDILISDIALLRASPPGDGKTPKRQNCRSFWSFTVFAPPPRCDNAKNARQIWRNAKIPRHIM